MRAAEGLYLGVDVGTSSLKLLAAGADGSIAGEYEQSLPVEEPAPGRVEAAALRWCAALDAGLDSLDVTRPRGAGVTGQMHGPVLLGADGGPVRPAILWPDTRAGDREELWSARPMSERAGLGGPFSAGMYGPALSWLAEHEPASLAAAEVAVLAKDVLRHHLTGTEVGSLVTDRSDASGTLLWDVRAERWQTGLAAAAGVPARLLPDVVASTALVGEWRGAPVVAGGGDTAVSLVALERAVGGWRSGDLVVNLGSGAQVIDPRPTAPPDTVAPGWQYYADCARGHYAMVAVVNAGLAVHWALRRLGLGWADYSARATRAPAGADGTVFVPFVSAERGAMRPPEAPPIAGPGWRGGSGDDTSRARAVAEAQVFLLRRARELLGEGAGRIFLIGGGARDRWVAQLLADTWQREVIRLEVRSAAALGAICLAAGPDFAVRAGVVQVVPRQVPGLDAAYRRWSEVCYGAVQRP